MLNLSTRPTAFFGALFLSLFVLAPCKAQSINPADYGVELENKATATVTTSILLSGATTFVYSYAVTNLPSSERAITEFSLQMDIPAGDLFAQQSPANWRGPNCCKRDTVRVSSTGISAISWMYFSPDDKYLPPGQTVSRFGFSAAGLPAIKRFFVTSFSAHVISQAELDPVSQDGAIDPVVNLLDFFNNSTSGITLGPEPTPADDGPAALLNRLVSLKERSVSLGWLRGEEFIKDLDEKLDQARKALAESKASKARHKLREFIQKLAEQSKEQLQRQHEASEEGRKEREEHSEGDKKFVNDNAFYLLKSNAQFIVSKLPAPPNDEDDEKSDQDGGDRR